MSVSVSIPYAEVSLFAYAPVSFTTHSVEADFFDFSITSSIKRYGSAVKPAYINFVSKGNYTVHEEW